MNKKREKGVDRKQGRIWQRQKRERKRSDRE